MIQVRNGQSVAALDAIKCRVRGKRTAIGRSILGETWEAVVSFLWIPAGLPPDYN